MTLAQNIRAAREKAGLTVKELAQAVDVYQNTVYRWERGERVPPEELKHALAKALGCGVADFYR